MYSKDYSRAGGKRGCDIVRAREMLAESWEGVAGLAARVDDVGDPTKCTYVFRGQEDAAWGLRPSLHRAVTNDDLARSLPEVAELLRLEKFLTGRFAAFAATHLPAAILASSRGNLDWWPIMQHYGVPTRLLDWTQSFYVALYFAARRLPDRDGAVYLLHVHTLQESMKTAHGDKAVVPATHADCDRLFGSADAPNILYIVERKSALVDRMVAQQGLFVGSCNIAADLEPVIADAVSDCEVDGNAYFKKVIIPARLKALVMRRLRGMNVAASALFPGLDGIGRQLDDLVRHR
jgi:hypothetical protein